MNAGNAGRRLLLGALAAVATAGWVSGALAESRTFSFAYDQPNTTAYGIAANIFDAKLKELSGGTMSINQFPVRNSARNRRCCRRCARATSTSSSRRRRTPRRSRRRRACSRFTSSSATRQHL